MRWDVMREGRTDLQLLQPVLTLGLLVLARLCFGASVVIVEVEDELGEMVVVGTGERALSRCCLTSSGDISRRRAEIRRGSCSEQLPFPTVKGRRRARSRRAAASAERASSWVVRPGQRRAGG